MDNNPKIVYIKIVYIFAGALILFWTIWMIIYPVGRAAYNCREHCESQGLALTGLTVTNNSETCFCGNGQ